jgi:hypothetical protein
LVGENAGDGETEGKIKRKRITDLKKSERDEERERGKREERERIK